MTTPDPTRLADTAVPVHPLVAARWSPRALDATATLDDTTLTALLEAARWASSWGGSQPARFIVGRRGDETFDGLVSTLSRGNRSWAPRASALVLGVTRVRDGEKVLTHSAFDLGQAVAQLTLQAVSEGLVTHPMAGFDAEAARARFGVPEDFAPLVLVAVGSLADPSTVEPELAAKEQKPRARRALAEVAFAGTWGAPVLG
jgi:nitroreductase